MTCRSMTGFGRGVSGGETLQISVELKTVNHRYLDVVTKLPAAYAAQESEVVRQVRQRLNRGRVDVTVNRAEITNDSSELHFNKALFRQYVKAAQKAFELADVVGTEGMTRFVVQLLQRKEILELVPKTVEQDENSFLLAALQQALDSLSEMREREGETLEHELLNYLDQLEEVANRVQGRADLSVSQTKERLDARIAKLFSGLEIEPARFVQEAALLAERSDISEELSRLRSHIEQFRNFIAAGESGRKLDFLVQEMHREMNTTGSKSSDIDISRAVVDGKAIIEKIREQVQNVE